MALRAVARVVDTVRVLEGGGFPVRRPFPVGKLSQFDPFLLLDHFHKVWGPNEAIGAPDHPHRGFETVSYLIAGEMQHRDSRGNHGRLGPGDVQWMTAGSGVVHSEMPTPEFRARGGETHGFQVWVNLPQRDKMIAPRYQEIAASQMPVARTPDGLVAVKVIAGDVLGVHARIETRTPILYHHYTLQPGGTIDVPVPHTMNCMAYVFEGGVTVDAARQQGVRTYQAVFFEPSGDTVRLSHDAAASGGKSAQLILLGGEPLNEPMVRYGPFVMNTAEEIEQAFVDFHSGRLGRIEGSDADDE